MVRERQRREVDVGLVLGALAQAERQPLEAIPTIRPPAAATNSWLKRRHHRQRGRRRAATGRPGPRASRGRSRPSSAAISSIAPAGLRRPRRRRRAGTPCRRRSAPAARQLEVDDLARRTRSGTCSRMPAPSPVSGSAPVAPRCSRLRSAVMRLGRRCRGWPRRSGWRRTRRRRRRARGVRRRDPGAAGTRACGIPPVVVAPSVVRRGGRLGRCSCRRAGDDIGPGGRELQHGNRPSAALRDAVAHSAGRRPDAAAGSADPGAADQAAERRRSGRPRPRRGASAAGRRTTRSGW